MHDVGLPSGPVTLLFTDIAGSTRLWERDQLAMRNAIERHLSTKRQCAVTSDQRSADGHAAGSDYCVANPTASSTVNRSTSGSACFFHRDVDMRKASSRAYNLATCAASFGQA